MMADIDSYETKSGKRYRVRYRTPDNKQTDKRGFKTKREAELFQATLDLSIAKGAYIPVAAGRETITALGTQWVHLQTHLKPSSYAPIESSWRTHVQSKWGHWKIGTITHTDVQKWVSELSKTRSGTVVRRAHGILAAILDTAVKDKKLSENRARGIKLPPKGKKPRTYLTHEQVALLATLAKYPTLVNFLAYTGLRWGEATGLRIKHVNFLKRRVNIEENAVMVGSTIHVGTPKSHENRSVPFPKFLTPALEHLTIGKAPANILFGDGQTHMKLPDSRDGWLIQAIKKAQEIDNTFPARFTPHDFRHTAASLAISSGANVKAVQRMLGHASAAMTLDIYADLFDDDLDAVSESMDTARLNSNVGKMWAKG